MKKQHKKKQFVSYFFRLRTLQKSSSRVGGVTISENDLKKSCFFRCHFWSRFLLKMRFFQHILTCLTTRKRCFLQWKLSIFMFYQKIETQKNEQKNTSKMMKKWVREPQKWGSCRGEMVGCEKTVFFKKKQPSQKSSKNMLRGPLPKPYFLQWIRRIFTLKKSQLFGSLLAPFGSLMFPKPYFYNEFQWF